MFHAVVGSSAFSPSAEGDKASTTTRIRCQGFMGPGMPQRLEALHINHSGPEIPSFPTQHGEVLERGRTQWRRIDLVS